MKPVLPVLCALCVVVGSGAALVHAATPLPVASPTAEGFSPARLDRLHRFMRGVTDSADYLGAVTLVARHGKIVDWRGYGRRDFATSSPMDRNSIFRIYSMTKTMTSVAVLMLM